MPPCFLAQLMAFFRDIEGYTDEGSTHPLEKTFPGIEFLELAVQRKDGRVLLGCPMDFPGFDDRPTVAGIAMTLAALMSLSCRKS